MTIVFPENDTVTKTNTAVHRKKYIQFCIENVKCAMFTDLSYKGICESNNTVLQHVLTKWKVNCIAFKALKC